MFRSYHQEDFIHSFDKHPWDPPWAKNYSGHWGCDGRQASKALLSIRASARFLHLPFSWDDIDDFKVSKSEGTKEFPEQPQWVLQVTPFSRVYLLIPRTSKISSLSFPLSSSAFLLRPGTNSAQTCSLLSSQQSWLGLYFHWWNHPPAHLPNSKDRFLQYTH